MNKKLKSIEVGLIGCGDAVTLTAEDTTTAPIASYALDEFKRKEQMEFVNDGKDYFVPFHAVDHIEVTETSVSVADRPNPYGCEGGSEPTSETYTLKWTDAYDSTDVKVGDTLTSPPNPCGGFGAFQGWVFGGNEPEPGSIVIEANTSFTFTKDMADVAIDGVISIGYMCAS